MPLHRNAENIDPIYNLAARLIERNGSGSGLRLGRFTLQSARDAEAPDGVLLEGEGTAFRVGAAATQCRADAGAGDGHHLRRGAGVGRLAPQLLDDRLGAGVR